LAAPSPEGENRGTEDQRERPGPSTCNYGSTAEWGTCLAKAEKEISSAIRSLGEVIQDKGLTRGERWGGKKERFSWKTTNNKRWIRRKPCKMRSEDVSQGGFGCKEASNGHADKSLSVASFQLVEKEALSATPKAGARGKDGA